MSTTIEKGQKDVDKILIERVGQNLVKKKKRAIKNYVTKPNSGPYKMFNDLLTAKRPVIDTETDFENKIFIYCTNNRPLSIKSASV